MKPLIEYLARSLARDPDAVEVEEEYDGDRVIIHLRVADDDKGRRLAEEHGKPMSAASDAHTPWEIGLAYTELPDFEGPEGFLQSIGKGKIVGKRAFFGLHFISTWAKIKWRLHLGRRVAQ